MTSGNGFSFAKHLVAPYEGREQTPVALDALAGLREAASPRLAAKLWQSETRDSGSGGPIWETGVMDVGAVRPAEGTRGCVLCACRPLQDSAVAHAEDILKR